VSQERSDHEDASIRWEFACFVELAACVVSGEGGDELANLLDWADGVNAGKRVCRWQAFKKNNKVKKNISF